MTSQNKVCLVVIDGWGIAEPRHGNAITSAKTPIMSSLTSKYSHVQLIAHGVAVGLVHDQMGNSEVGHLNIGTGRVVDQDILRINKAVAASTFLESPALERAFIRAKENGRLHLIGLISDGGVHSHINHLYALLAAAKKYGIPQSFIHFFTDGRDTSPQSAAAYLHQLRKYISETSYGCISSMVGRYYAMDRDTNYTRTQAAYDLLVKGIGEEGVSYEQLLEEKYAQGLFDELLPPMCTKEIHRIQDNDSVVCFNYRADRMRQIVKALAGVPDIVDNNPPKNLLVTTMTKYGNDFPNPEIFDKVRISNSLAESISTAGFGQSHIAETEKYAHITFFFNGGTEEPFPEEERVCIPSHKVKTHDLMPSMRAAEIATQVARAIETGKKSFVMCNLANPDMVGHTGNYEATIQAVEETDKAIGIILGVCQKHGYTLFITADHGNAECEINEDGGVCTAHTINPVPFICASEKFNLKAVPDAALSSVAPTILECMGIQQPREMTGRSLLVTK